MRKLHQSLNSIMQSLLVCANVFYFLTVIPFDKNVHRITIFVCLAFVFCSFLYSIAYAFIIVYCSVAKSSLYETQTK